MDFYQQQRKENLIQQATGMGYDTFQVQDIIEENGIYENSMDLLVTALSPGYANPLKMQMPPGFHYQQPPNPYMRLQTNQQFPPAGMPQQQQFGVPPGGYMQPPPMQQPVYNSAQPQGGNAFAYYDPSSGQ